MYNKAFLLGKGTFTAPLGNKGRMTAVHGGFSGKSLRNALTYALAQRPFKPAAQNREDAAASAALRISD